MIPLHKHSGMEPMHGMVYIYALCHPATREPRYIGQSVDPASRYNQHLSDKKGRKAAWITRLKRRQKRPVLLILAFVPSTSADSIERFLIGFFGRSCRLLNSQPGCKPLYNEAMKAQRVMLPNELIEKARQIGGGGNLSKGVRIALEAYAETDAP